MGLFDFFKKKPAQTKPAPSLNGWVPMYGQFGTDIYASDAVVQALKCIVDELKKLRPVHVRYNGSDPVPQADSTVQAVFDNPNPLMTTSEFLEKTFWLLLLNYNAFIIPTYRVWKDPKTGAEKRYYEALYPIKPTQVDFIEDASDRLYVKFYFMNGWNTTIPYDDVIHLKYNYSVNDYMGGDEGGQPNHKALLKTLELNHELLTGLAKAMKSSYSLSGVVKYNTLMDDGKMAANLEELETKLNNSESGFLPIDMKADFTPLPKSGSMVDQATIDFLDEKILRSFGVPLSILKGSYTKEEYEAFYQKTLEPFIISAAQAFTKKLFTTRERAFGHKLELYPKDLIFLSMSQTLEMINILAPTGALYENEKRIALGLKPLPELEGKRYMSLNWINAEKADDYQAGKVGIDAADEEKTEEVTEE